MATASIYINGSPAPALNIGIGSTCTLSNANNTGVSAWLWELLDRPTGSTAALSSSSVASPTFIADKEGSYLVRLTINSTEATTTAVAAVRHLLTGMRLPAALERNEANNTRGWSESLNSAIATLEDHIGDGGLVIAVAGDVLSVGQVVRTNATSIIGNGDRLPTVVSTNASVESNLPAFGIVTTQATAAGQIIKIRVCGHLIEASVDTTGKNLGDPIYISNTGTLSTTPGTIVSVIGYVHTVGVSGSVCIIRNLNAASTSRPGLLTTSDKIKIDAIANYVVKSGDTMTGALSFSGIAVDANAISVISGNRMSWGTTWLTSKSDGKITVGDGTANSVGLGKFVSGTGEGFYWDVPNARLGMFNSNGAAYLALNIGNGMVQATGNIALNTWIESASGNEIQVRSRRGVTGTAFASDTYSNMTSGYLYMARNLGTDKAGILFDGTIESKGGGFKFPDGSIQTTAATPVTGYVSKSGDTMTGELFITGAGLTVDGGVLHVDATSNRVGINVPGTPVKPLHVVGDSYFSGNIGIGANASGANTTPILIDISETAKTMMMLRNRTASSAGQISLYGDAGTYRLGIGVAGSTEARSGNAFLELNGANLIVNSYNAGTPLEKIRITEAGEILFGTVSNPNGSKIIAAGAIETTNIGYYFPDGSLQTTAYLTHFGRVSISTASTVNAGTQSTFGFDTVEIDVGDMFPATPSSFKAPRDGYYDVSVTLEATTATANTNLEVTIMVDGVATMLVNEWFAHVDQPEVITLTGIVYVAGSTSCSIRVAEKTGSGNISFAAGRQHFSAKYIGK